MGPIADGRLASISWSCAPISLTLAGWHGQRPGQDIHRYAAGKQSLVRGSPTRRASPRWRDLPDRSLGGPASCRSPTGAMKAESKTLASPLPAEVGCGAVHRVRSGESRSGDRLVLCCIQCSLVTWLLSHPGRAESGQLSGSQRPAGDAPAPIHIAQALEWARVSTRAPDRTWLGFPGCTAQLHRSLAPDNCGGWVGFMYCGSGFGIQERLHQVSRVSGRVVMVIAREIVVECHLS
jgi:hypothetical protein